MSSNSTSSAAEEDDRVCRQVYGMQQEEPLFEGGFLKEFVTRGLNRHADDLCPAGCQSNDVCMMGFTVEACKVFGNRHLYNRVWYRRKMFHFAKADREAQIVAGIIEAVKKPEGGPPGRFMCRDFSQGGQVFQEAPLELAQAHVRLAFRLANSTRMTYAPRRRQDEEKKKAAPSADLASAKDSQKGKAESIATALDRMEFTPTNASTNTDTRKTNKPARLSTKREEPEDFGDATRMCGTVGWYDTDIAMTALSNYETFYKMASGTADLSVVEATSAGVEGWAFCCLDVDNMVPPSSSTKDIPDVSKPAAKPAAACKKPRAKKETTTRPSVGDQEEKRQLQLVLLESIGVRNPYTNLSNNETDQEDTEDDDNNSQDNDNISTSSYSYEYDTEEEEEEEGGDQARNPKDAQEEEEAGGNQVVPSVIPKHQQATAQDDNHSVPDNEEEEEEEGDADEEGTTTSGSFLHVSDMGSLYSRDDSWQDSEDERDFAALQELIENQRL